MVTSSSGGNWTLTGVSTAGWVGTQTIFAIANGPYQSDPITLVINQDDKPVIDSLDVVSATVTPVPPLALVADSPSLGAVFGNAYTGAFELHTEFPSAVNPSAVNWEYFDVYQFNGSTYDIQPAILQVMADGSVDFQLYKSDGSDYSLFQHFSYDSWWDFKASDDYSPLFWNLVEGSDFGADDSAFFNDLNQFNGEGLLGVPGGDLSSGPYLALTANIAGGQNQITKVQYYEGSPVSGTLIGTVNAGLGSWTYYVAASSFSDPQDFYAVATDSTGQTSDPATFTFTAPTISVGSLSSDHNNRYVAGSSITLTAAGLTGSVANVKLYQDLSGTGIYNSATVKLVDNITTGITTSASYMFTAGNWTDPQAFFAIAETSGSVDSAPVAVTVSPDQGPSIDGLAVSTASGNLVLTASGVTSPDGSIAGVVFYKGDLSHPISGTPVSDGQGNWTQSGVSASGFSTTVPEPIIVEATDDMGQVFDFTVNQKPIVVGAFSANSGSNLYIAGNSLTFNLSGIVDWNSSPGTITASFDLDTSGTGTYNAGSLLNLGTATVSSGTATVTVSGGAVDWTGQQIVFVSLHDSSGATIVDSDPIGIVLSPNLPPVADSVAATVSIPSTATIPVLTAGIEGTAFGFYSTVSTNVLDFPVGTTLTGNKLGFTSYTWNNTLQEWNDPQYVVMAGSDIQFWNPSTNVKINEFSYASWSAFEASSDFDPNYWAAVEGNMSGTALAYLQNLFGQPSSTSPQIALTANVFSPYGSIATVAFYAGSAVTGSPIATLSTPAADGTWTAYVAPAALAGQTDVTIRVTDGQGLYTDLPQPIGPILMGQLTANAPTYSNDQPVSVSIASIVDLTSGATITGVKIYRVLDGTGVYTPGMVQYLGDATLSGNTWTLPGIDPSGWAGTTTLLALADDSNGAQGGPAFVQLAAPANPVPEEELIKGNKFGDWNIKQQNTNLMMLVQDATYDSNTTITFKSKGDCDCDEIAFVQIAREIKTDGTKFADP